jgi:hypothetical protein
MPYPQLDRFSIRMKSLAERKNKKRIEADHVSVSMAPRLLNEHDTRITTEALNRIRAARRAGRPVMLTFGAHTIKNGLAPVLIELMSSGWLTHLATNGAGIIHDWEFAFLGQSSEDVQGGVARGEFGNWQETGFNINLAINIGAMEGKGYGEAVGAMIANDGLRIPAATELEQRVEQMLYTDPGQAGSAAECLAIVKRFNLTSGWLAVPHPWKQYSVQAAAYQRCIPLTGHPMIGHDIIYNHPMNNGALLGRAALRDFLSFAESVSRLAGGVYISLGSAVMSPMIFEKSLSMAQNVAMQQGTPIDDYYILVVDLAESRWDWAAGEPPESSPEYYMRYNKSFSRMGGTMRYLSADNRDFLLHLHRGLEAEA